ncbi:hypothetical protein [Motiliproteus sp. SC1-56]|uniref:hypothetical protein n=1 Tax=Motiliproteus sp. SC1-56 TaxID=2799565 RepID=UPI001A8F0C04|nr:hypothetical protein [Motiliproteus sp. SC1-56]
MVGAVMNEGVRGMQVAQRGLDQAAQDIARAPAESARQAQSLEAPAKAEIAPERRQDLVQPLVELERQEQIFTASAKVVSTANQTLGTVLDILA